MLTLCPTPIGNLADVTPRQLEALRTADIVACEDSRTTGKLFELLGLSRADGKPRFIAYHEHNEVGRVAEILDALRDGQRVVLVSDAGTPAISDPGYRLVHAAREAGLPVQVLPGPVAGAMAVAGSGLPTDRWVFEGFAPAKQGTRIAALERARGSQATAVFYESPNRLAALLGDIAQVFGEDHPVCVARELTKLHEEWNYGPAGVVRDRYADGARGEVVVVVGPADVAPRDDVDSWIASMVAEGVAPKAIKAIVASAAGISKSDVFTRMERLKRSLSSGT